MNPDRQPAIEYLRAPANGLWRWADDGTVVVWRDGSTVAFREEIRQILAWLSPGALPSFGAIVFLLAALRGKLPALDDLVRPAATPLPAEVGQRAAVLSAARDQLVCQIEAAINEVAKVTTLPAELKTGLKARCVLAEAVFEGARAERHVEAQGVLRGMGDPMSDADINDTEHPGTIGSYIRQIHVVAEGLKRHTAESLALRMKTGLDSLPHDVGISLPPAQRARRLIDELSRDRELGALARAARELTAAVRLPRRLAEREQLAIGGVADITNRGPLDRLLLSELAHDDLTLSVRVALNEALYLRREPPMREPPGTLAILLDTGLRLWGIPRVLATAVALALAARDKQHSEILSWCARGKEIHPVDLLSRNGLVHQLGTLTTTAHVGESLSAFEHAVAPGEQNQSIVITHRDALDDPDFRRALDAHPLVPGFVATVDRAGQFELHSLPLTRRPPLCEATLDLKTIFHEKPDALSIRVNIEPHLPAIFGLRPFPFLLPLSGQIEMWTNTPDGMTFACLNNRSLVQFRDRHRGGRVLATDLPAGRLLWMGCVDETVHLGKVGTNNRPARLISHPLPHGPTRVVDLVTGDEVRAVFAYGDVILLLRSSDVRAHSLEDGRLLHRAVCPHSWTHGRYFRGKDHFYFAAWDGAQVRFEVVTHAPYAASVIAGIFDREGTEGPWLVHCDGTVLCSVNPMQRWQLTMPPDRRFGIDHLRIARTGHRIYAGVTPKSGCLLDLQSGIKQNLIPDRSRRLVLDLPPQLPVRNLFSAFDGIARFGNGLALHNRKGHWRQISLNSRDELIVHDLPASEIPEISLTRQFAPMRETSPSGCRLQVAEWPNGSKAFLDDRGLLHLKSHDPAVAEISLVLGSKVAGWTSDGHACGPAFFFEQPINNDAFSVHQRLKQFLQRL